MKGIKICIVIVLALVSLDGMAQFAVSSTSSNPEQVIRENLIGEGIEILSVEYHGGKESIASFSSGRNTGGHPDGLSIEDGLLITTGAAEQVSTKGVGPGEQEHDLVYQVGNSADAVNHQSLVELAGPNAIIQDFSIIKVTFRPETDTFRINYVWASEEYPYYVCSDFNDKFGFIISGEGISGNFYGGKGKNIAIIPGTDLPVTINNLNNGQTLDYDTVDPKNCAQEALDGKTKKFFIDNLKYSAEARPAFNGYTVPLEAKAAVIPCEVYTIELIVTDINDEKQDSGVFFEKGSFRTEKAEYTVVTANSDNTIVEGCENATLKLDSKNRFSTPLPLEAELKGGAQLGVDYIMTLNGNQITDANQLILPPNENQMNIEIEAIEDNISEGVETIEFSFRKAFFVNPLAKCDEQRDTITLFIKDNELKAKDLPDEKKICKGTSLDLDGTITTTIEDGGTYEEKISVDILPEKTDVFSTIEVSGNPLNAIGANSLPTICINVDHPNVKDLDISIISPDNKELLLVSGVKKEWQKNFEKTCFTIDATTAIVDGEAPFQGNFLPVGNFNSLEGALINGTWRLKLNDKFTGITGTLQSWSIQFKNPYSVMYSWTPTDEISNTDTGVTSVKPSASTTYKLSINDIYGCTLVDSTQVIVEDGFPLTIDTTHNTCYGEERGAIKLSSSDSSLSFIWEDGSTQSERNNLKAGEYSVTIKGDSGCERNETIRIVEPEALTYSTEVTSSSCAGNDDGKLKVTVTGGTAPYTIAWDELSETGFDIDKLKAGTYNATITDANGCSEKLSATVQENAPFSIDDSSKHVSCHGANDGSITLSVTGNTAEITYEWNGPNGYSNTSASVADLAPGLYSVKITEKDGCSLSRQFEIHEPSGVQFSASSENIQCHGESTGKLTVTAAGGTAPLSYSIDGGQNFVDTGSFSGLKAGSYAIKVKDGNGCITTKDTTIMITEPEEITIQMDSIKNLVYGESTTLEAKPSLSEDQIQSIVWTPTDYLSCADCLVSVSKPEYSTTYLLTITDQNGCSVTKRAIVQVDRTPRVDVPNIFSPNGDRRNDEVSIITDNVLVKRINDFRIYNRWGSLVFEVEDKEPNSPDLAWDGTFNGSDLQPGVYVWIAHILLDDNIVNKYTGTITIVK